MPLQRRSLISLGAALGLFAAGCGDAAETTTTIGGPVVVTTTTPPATSVEGTTTAAPVTAAPPTTTLPETTTTLVVSPKWTGVATDGGAPPARRNPVLVFDPATMSLYLHGGRTAGDARTDLWRYDVAARSWVEIVPDGELPPDRFSHTGIWDRQRGRLVIFSGQGGPGRFFSDVWAYDPTGNDWIQLAANDAGPLNRYGSCAGYDHAADRFLISHGFTDDGRFDDTWAFDLASDTWSEVSPEGDRPLRRCLHTCAWDEANQALVLFGGQSNDARAHDDAWVLSGGGWTEVPETGPAPRRFATGVPLGGSLVVFGGTGFEGELGDAWLLDVGDSVWTEVKAGEGPTPRHSHASAHDPVTGRMWVFGGSGADGELNDLWVLKNAG